MKVSDIEVTLIDFMGTDLDVVNAARVSFNKESEWGDERLLGKDTKLISYLAKHNHWSPFSHCFAKFRVKAPIFVARQLQKHTVGFSWNEVSRRYVDDAPEFYFPEVWRSRPEGSVKQGSGDVLENNEMWSQAFAEHVKNLLGFYNHAISCGMAPEQARMSLPQNMMTEWIWSGSLYAFARMCLLRLDSHTQKETQDVARIISAHMNAQFPDSWKVLVQEDTSSIQ